MSEAKREAMLIQLMRDVCEEVGLPEEKEERAPILEALNVAYNKGAESAQPAERAGEWIPWTPAEAAKLEPHDSAWLIWCGVVQEVPYTWQEKDDEWAWEFEGTRIVDDGVSDYWPLKAPPPPQPKEKP